MNFTQESFFTKKDKPISSEKLKMKQTTSKWPKIKENENTKNLDFSNLTSNKFFSSKASNGFGAAIGVDSVNLKFYTLNIFRVNYKKKYTKRKSK
jgi:hypothetical protein